MKFETYWKKLRDTGWLEYVPSDRHQETLDQIRRNLAEEPDYTYMALVQGTVETGADTPEDMLNTLVQMSHGKFHPENAHVVASESEEEIEISFAHDSRRFSTKAIGTCS